MDSTLRSRQSRLGGQMLRAREPLPARARWHMGVRAHADWPRWDRLARARRLGASRLRELRLRSLPTDRAVLPGHWPVMAYFRSPMLPMLTAGDVWPPPGVPGVGLFGAYSGHVQPARAASRSSMAPRPLGNGARPAQAPSNRPPEQAQPRSPDSLGLPPMPRPHSPVPLPRSSRAATSRIAPALAIVQPSEPPQQPLRLRGRRPLGASAGLPGKLAPAIPRTTWPQPFPQSAPPRGQVPDMAAPAGAGESSGALENRARPVFVRPGAGAQLEPELRGPLERAMGMSLSSVRVHTDHAAAAAAERLHAHAFTVGHHIFFAAGRFQPRTSPGLALLVHELTHVRQQPDGAPIPAGQLSFAQHRAMEQAAESQQEAVLRGAPPPPASTVAMGGRTGNGQPAVPWPDRLSLFRIVHPTGTSPKGSGRNHFRALPRDAAGSRATEPAAAGLPPLFVSWASRWMAVAPLRQAASAGPTPARPELPVPALLGLSAPMTGGRARSFIQTAADTAMVLAAQLTGPTSTPAATPTSSELNTAAPPSGAQAEQGTRSEAAAEADTAGGLNVDDLVDTVLRTLMRRLAIESERRGWIQWP